MILGIIQARINSDRFPIKIFAKFSDGSVVLERVIRQVLFSEILDKVVIATNYISFSSISSFVKSNFDEIAVISGSDNDVLDRFVSCLSIFDNVDVVVRITADNPLTCPKYIDYAIKKHLESKADLTHFLGIPLGTGVEVINPNTLFKISELTYDPYDREHVTPFIYKNRDIFKVVEPMFEVGNFQNFRVTIDTENDLFFVDGLLRLLDYKLPVYVEDIINVSSKVAEYSLVKSNLDL